MPWCPQCRTEYRPGFTHCADCGVPLVDELPPEAPSEELPPDDSLRRPRDPVHLLHCPTTLDADATLALLRSFGIPCFSQPDMGAEKIYTGFCLTGEHIYVEASQAEQAREIVRGFRRGRGRVDPADAAALMEQAGEPAGDSPPSNPFSTARTVVSVLFALAVVVWLFRWFFG